MRRTLKPFVTEYKQSNRRNQTALPDQNAFEGERPTSRLFEVGLREPEDSYDAAMRAADALFSVRSHASDVEQQPPSSRAFPLGSPADAQPLSDAHVSAPERTGGRILQAINEPPSPEYAALEAEHAPKRRGRKPGSKNKPKAPFFSKAETPPIVAVKAVSSSVAVQATSRPAAQQDVALKMPATPSSSARASKRFPWVRDRLRPGEDWKRRRLPKVCW